MPLWLTHNFGLKILAFLVALLVYAHVATERVYQGFIQLAVVLDGIPKSLAPMGEIPDSILVEVRGKTKELLKLRYSRQLVAHIDLSGARPGEVEVPLTSRNVFLPAADDLHIVSVVNPTTLVFRLAAKLRRQVPVVPSITGEVALGYSLVGVPLVEPERVWIEAVGSIVTWDSEILTDAVDVEGLSATTSQRVGVILPDDKYLSATPGSVLVTVRIEKILEE